jgi:LysM repeat protein
MSTVSPILPPGSPLQRSRPSNSKLLLSIFVIVAVHVFLLAGLLIQGCKRQDNTLPTDQSPARALEPSPTAPLDSGALAPTPNPLAAPPPAPANNTPPASAAPMPMAPAPAAPTPEPSAATVQPSARSLEPLPPTETPAPNLAPEGPREIYVVKRGDNLTRIAAAHGTTIRALRAVNGLTSDRILVGQKLKLPRPGEAIPTNAAPAAASPGAASPMGR